MKKNSYRNVWLGVMVGMTVTAQAATTIVDFELDGISSQRHARVADVGAVGVGTGDVWKFSDSTELIDSEDIENGTTRRSLKVYGGVNTSWNTSTEYNPNVRIDRKNQCMQVQVVAPGNKIEGLFIWNKADFFDGFDTKKVGFDASSVMSASFSSVNKIVRFVVNDGGTYYVSEQTCVGKGTHSLTDPESVDWASISTDGSYTIGAFESHMFSDIQGVGFYVNWTPSNGGQVNLKMTDFQVSAVSYEPPSTLGLIMAFSVGILFVRRNIRS